MDIPILMYHHLEANDRSSPYAVSIQQFNRQLDLISRAGFTTLSMRELQSLMERSLAPPRKSIILTFDDGYESFRELALPALLSRKMKAIVFIVAGKIGEFNSWDMARHFPRRQLMSEDGIREVLDEGMELGSHGWIHRDLTECSPVELSEELVRSREELQHRFNVDIGAFAYPYGHYNRDILKQVANAGYTMAVTIFADQPSVTDNLLAMRRVYIHKGDHTLRFRFKLSPLYLRFLARRGLPSRASNSSE
jgi:peptidoglycan/xylan/chitin deacetylase (PgdA/CDA1 family)